MKRLNKLLTDISKLQQQQEELISKELEGLNFPSPFIVVFYNHYTNPNLSALDSAPGGNRKIHFEIKENNEVNIKEVIDCSEDEVNECKNALLKWLQN